MNIILIIIGIGLVIYFFNYLKNKSSSKQDKIDYKPFKKGSYMLVGDWTMSLDKFRSLIIGLYGNEITIVPDPKNEYDSKAIKIYYKKDFIGWVPKSYAKKGELFNRLINGEKVYAEITHNNSWYGDQKKKMFFEISIDYQFVNDEELNEIQRKITDLEDKTEKPYDPNIEIKRNSYDRNFQARDLESKGYIENAIEIYETIIERKANLPNAYNRLAIIYRKRKEYQQEIDVLNKLISLHNDNDKINAIKKRIVKTEILLTKKNS